jgi:hypothetical protein
MTISSIQSNSLDRVRSNSLDTQPSSNEASVRARSQSEPIQSTRYADTSRPGLIQSAKVLLQIGLESLKFATNPTARSAALERLADLSKQAPQLSQNIEQLRSLFTRVDRPIDPTYVSVVSPSFSSDVPSSVDRLLQKPAFEEVKKNAYDDHAFVLNKGVASEPEQMRLMKATIESADKFAAVTTYGIKPIERNGKVTNTMHSVLAGLAQKQHDPEFNFVFLYNKSVGLQNLVTGGKRTQISLNPENTKQQQWPEVLDAYNKQAVDEYNAAVDQDLIYGEKIKSPEDFARFSKEDLQNLVRSGHLSGLPITDLKAKVYVVAADPGIGGSHHNKFAINDSGF